MAFIEWKTTREFLGDDFSKSPAFGYSALDLRSGLWLRHESAEARTDSPATQPGR